MTVEGSASANSSWAAPALREGSIRKQTVSLPAEAHGQARLDRPFSRSACTRQLVSSAWRSAALFRCARIAAPNGSNSGMKRGMLPANVPGETGSPWSASHALTRCRGREHA